MFFNKNIKYILMVQDFILFTLALFLAFFLRYLGLPDIEIFLNNLIYFLPLCLFFIFVLYVNGFYYKSNLWSKSLYYEILPIAQVINLFAGFTFFYFLNIENIAPKTILFLTIVLSSVFLFITRRELNSYVKKFPKLIFNISVETYRSNKDTLDALKEKVNYELKLFANNELPEYRADEFLVLDEFATDQAVLYAKAKIENGWKRENILIMNDIVDFLGWMNIELVRLFNMPWILNRNKYKYALMRGFDLILALIILPVWLFVMFGIAVLAYLMHGRPIFYISKRKGYMGSEIQIYKFRTLNGCDSDKEAIQTSLKPTMLGGVLRKLRFDELPQLVNIIKGDMSFVGPRPEIIGTAAKYEKLIPQYKLRYLVKPGLTGWAQVKQKTYPRGFEVLGTKEKLSYDLFYIKNTSLILNITILLYTISVVVKRWGK